MEPTPKSWLLRNRLLTLLLILPFILIAFTWQRLPDTIPIHWNAKGEIDDTGPKWMIALTPLIACAMILLVEGLLRLDPRNKASNTSARNALDKLMLALTSFFFILFVAGWLGNLGYPIDMTWVITFSVCLLFLFMGNFFGKIRSNYFVGIRTPWTLESEEVWNRTHRMAGKVWVIGSLALMLARIFLPHLPFIIVFLAGLFIISLWPVIYAYRLYRSLKKPDQDLEA